MNASNMKQSLSICQQDYTNKRTASQYICSIIHSNTFIHKPAVLWKGSTYFVSFDTYYNVPQHLALILTNQVMKCEEGTHLHPTNQVMKCTTRTLLHATNEVMKCTTRTLISFGNLPLMPPTRWRRNSYSCHQPGDEMYNPYSLSCHQSGDEMYNPYSNIIWQLAIHATNQGKKELILVPPTRWWNVMKGYERTHLRTTNQVMKATHHSFHQPEDESYNLYMWTPSIHK